MAKTPSPYTLTGGAVDTYAALFKMGPLRDGVIPSKTGRDQLVSEGLADRHEGWNWLTSAGVIAAVDAEWAHTWKPDR
jgi:hypothetical protein